MFRKSRPIHGVPTPQAKPKPIAHKDSWYVSKYTSPDELSIYLVNDFLMKDPGQKGGVRLDKAVLFGDVAHNDDQFEFKLATLLNKARRRVEVLNKGTNFTLEEADQALTEGRSLCGNCNKEFEGEDYLCPDCRE